MSDEYEITMSPLCQTISANRRTVQVQIYSGEDSDWILELVDENGNSIVWDERFQSDRGAMDQLLAEIEKEGLDSLIDNARVVDLPE